MTIEPYSPIERDKLSVAPEKRLDRIRGKIICSKISQSDAPKTQAASSYSTFIPCKTGWTVRITKGSETNIIAKQTRNSDEIVIAGINVNIFSKNPCLPYKNDNVNPATAVGNANGRSTQISKKLRPTNS